MSLKDKNKVTIVYLDNINSTRYTSKVVTKRTLKKWKEEGNKGLKDAIFFLNGAFKDLTTFNINSYEKYGILEVLKLWEC